MMKAKKVIDKNYKKAKNALYVGTTDFTEDCMKEYAQLKCKKLLIKLQEDFGIQLNIERTIKKLDI